MNHDNEAWPEKGGAMLTPCQLAHILRFMSVASSRLFSQDWLAGLKVYALFGDSFDARVPLDIARFWDFVNAMLTLGR